MSYLIIADDLPGQGVFEVFEYGEFRRFSKPRYACWEDLIWIPYEWGFQVSLPGSRVGLPSKFGREVFVTLSRLSCEEAEALVASILRARGHRSIRVRAVAAQD